MWDAIYTLALAGAIIAEVAAVLSKSPLAIISATLALFSAFFTREIELLQTQDDMTILAAQQKKVDAANQAYLESETDYDHAEAALKACRKAHGM